MKDITAKDWNERYLKGDIPWDLSGPTPEFIRLLSTGQIQGPLLIPGGGRGYDAITAAQRGIETHLLDFAPAAGEAAQELSQKANTKIHTHCLDFFTLAASPLHFEKYNTIWEYTFFCAIEPSLRPQYPIIASQLIRPGGKLVALFFPTATDKEGPPFLVSRKEIEDLFCPLFDLEFQTPQASVKPRAGREFIGIFRKK